MELEYRDVVDAIKEALRPDENDDEKIEHMMPIPAFNAVDHDDNLVRVVGVVAQKDGCLNFLVIRQFMDDGGSFMPLIDKGIYPASADAVWPQPAPAVGST